MDQSLFEAMELADLYEKGLPPVEGAALDQSKWFVEACRFFWFECRRIENALGILK